MQQVPENVRDAAVAYATMGLAPIPLYGLVDGKCACKEPDCTISAGKHPKGNAWQKRATSDVDKVRAEFAGHVGNIGIALGSNFLVVDVDGDVGRASVAAWELPETWVQDSGGGGEHHLFRLAPHHDRGLLGNRTNVLPKVDIRARNGQIVAAPSVHRSGKPYVWRASTLAEPAVLPENVYRVLTNRVPSPLPPAPQNYHAPVIPINKVERARKYIDKMPPSISGSGGHLATFNVARRLVKDFALPDGDAWSLLKEYNASRCSPPWSEHDLRHKFEDAHKARVAVSLQDRSHPHIQGALAVKPGIPDPAANDLNPWQAYVDFKTTKTGGQQVRNHVANAVCILTWHPEMAGRIRRNKLSGAVDTNEFPFDDSEGGKKTGAWTDHDTYRLIAKILRIPDLLLVEFGRDIMEAAVEIVADTNAYHPVRDWLESLDWDGVERLPSWLMTYMGAAASEYTSVVGVRFMVSAVARAYDPGCQVDAVPIFEGTQGVGKSTSMRALFGSEWFSDTPLDIGSKDSLQAIQGKWCIEIGELDGFSRKDEKTLKAFFSSQMDTFRPAYGRRPVTYRRSCVFVGTTNQQGYLRDLTGNRRYWPIECGKVNRDELAEDREQLWAEAVARYKANENWWLTPEEEATLPTQIRNERLAVQDDPWFDKVAEFAEGRVAAGKPKVRMLDILNVCLGVDVAKVDGVNGGRVAAILTALGWEKQRSSTERWWSPRVPQSGA